MTLEDIAERLGTSKNTVSRALRDCSDIGAAMKERVKQTAMEMGYVPNRIAGFLRSKRSNIIAVAITSLTNPFFAICMDHCTDYMGEKGYRPLISIVRGELDVEDVISCIQNGACGILSFLDVTDEAIDYCEQNKVPLFLCGFKPRRERVCAIYSDAYQCAKLVAQEAVSCGAKRPCYVGYGKGALNEDRKEGFIATLRSNELSCDIYSFSYYSREQSLEKLKKSVRENENDFVFCFNDEIAASVQETMESVENFRGEIYGVDRFSEYLPYCRKVKSVGGRLSVIGRRT
ncbi:MAG TPA: LacI family transcriptional regulator, partial [Candidatus Gallimonas gallistercoris]|nr:LacI family transcriptional regulator [Candidatus Gallimonas gallistercoris]